VTGWLLMLLQLMMMMMMGMMCFELLKCSVFVYWRVHIAPTQS